MNLHPVKDQRAGRGDGQVRDRTGRGDQHHVALGIAQAREVHRYGLRPTEEKSRVTDQQQQRQDHAAERIDVRQRVQSQPAGALRGVVAERVGRVAVRDFVEDHGDENGKDPKRDLQQLLAHVGD